MCVCARLCVCVRVYVDVFLRACVCVRVRVRVFACFPIVCGRGISDFRSRKAKKFENGSVSFEPKTPRSKREKKRGMEGGKKEERKEEREEGSCRAFLSADKYPNFGEIFIFIFILSHCKHEKTTCD